MKELVTEDGSITFYNEEFGDVYNSKSGAKEESLEKFVKPCKIKEISEKRKILILDVCFGLGYNTLVALEYGKKENIRVIGLERDSNIVKKILDLDFCYEIKEAAKACLEGRKSESNVTIVLGDARESVNILSEVDAVFLDPFSPSVCPELWSEDFILEISNKMKKDAILATYSCAKWVRENMKKSGLEVFDGPCVGRKAPSTYAVKKEQ